jgi:hypothetical protein
MDLKRVVLGAYLFVVGGVLLADASLDSTLLGVALVSVVSFALICSRDRLDRWLRPSRSE